MNKLALQADLCYNHNRNIVALGGAGHTPSRIHLIGDVPMDTIPSNTPQKQCRDCKDFFPATPEYFHHSHRYSDGLNSMCKVCKKKEYQKSKEREHITVAEKRCTSCENVFPGTSEFFHSNRVNKDGLNSRCKSCIRAYQNSPGTREHILAKKADYRSRPETKENARSYQKFYRTRPEVQDRNRIRDRERGRSSKRLAWQREFRNRPEQRERVRTYQQAYYSKSENHERKLAQDRAYHWRPEIREQHLAYGKAHYRFPEVQEQRRAYRNRPEIQERQLAWRKEYTSRSDVQDRTRIWREDYYSRPDVQERKRIYLSRPDVRARYRAHSVNRNARKNAVLGHYTSAQIQEQLKRQRYRCYYGACEHIKFKRDKSKSFGYDFHIDHTYPLSRVIGTDIPANDISYLVLACPKCNLSKNNKFPWEWPEGGRLL